MLFVYVLNRLNLVSHLVVAVVVALAANCGVAWMIPLTDESTMPMYFTGFNLCIVATCMFIFARTRVLLTVALVILVTLITGIEINGQTTYLEILARGGLAWITMLVFGMGLFVAKMAMLKENYRLVKKIEFQNSKLEEYAYRDSLTETYNRRFLDKVMDRVDESSDVYSVVFCDVNSLKRINDVYGHEAGDAYIVRCAQILKKVKRKTDILIRQGGDELVVLCPNTNAQQARSLVHRIHERASQATISCRNEETSEVCEEPVSMSVGIASSDEFEKELIIKAADDRMIQNKVKWYDKQGTRYR
jgi:diguanylate cyclase (GGDEF)-like protein